MSDDPFDIRKRPVLPTLAALFVVVAGGQMLSAVSGSYAHAAKSKPRVMASAVSTSYAARPAATPIAEGDASFEGGSTSDGIVIIDERAAPAPVEDWDTKIRAERYRLRKERAQLEAEKDLLAEDQRRLDGNQTEQHRHLAAMYAKMPASKAAAVLVKLKPGEAATFVSLMPGDAGADVLAAMPADAAVAITREVLARTIVPRSTTP